jgi:hypothetical protein
MTPRKIAVLLTILAFGAQGQVYVSAPVTGATAPASANLSGVVSSGSLTGLVGCDSSALLSMTTSTTTQIVALQAGKSIHVCGFVVNAGGTTTARIVQGTGTNCATGLANMTPAFNLASGGNVSFGNSVGRLLKTNSGSALCITSTAAVALNILVIYTAF